MTLRARLLNGFLRRFVKPQLQRTATPQQARKSFEFGARWGFVTPPFTLKLSTEFRVSDRTLTASWISNCVHNRSKVLLYFHGGGYIVGNADTHAGMLAYLSKLTGVQVFVPNYRLAPEHAFPSQFDDALAAWNYLVELGYRPDNIVIGGDSAGGGLALALLGKLCQMGTPPAGTFAMSPWTDLTLSGDSLKINAKRDAILPLKRIEDLRDYVLQGADPKDPRISPFFSDFPDSSPVFLQGGSTEILADDLARIAVRIADQGGAVESDIWVDLPHVWPIFQGRLPEADHALGRIAKFMTAQLPKSSAGES